MIYVLVRTSGRPRYFKRCIESIQSQRHSGPVRIVVGNDNNDAYCQDFHPVRFVRNEDYDHARASSIDTAKYFPFNGYLNRMLQECTEQGWVIFLDDDDMFTSKHAIATIMDHLKEDNQVAFWRVRLHDVLVPPDRYWMKRPVLRNISMIGFCFNTKYIPLIYMAPWKQADWRLADQLYSMCEPKWIDKTLTMTDNEGAGTRNDL